MMMNMITVDHAHVHYRCGTDLDWREWIFTDGWGGIVAAEESCVDGTGVKSKRDLNGGLRYA